MKKIILLLIGLITCVNYSLFSQTVIDTVCVIKITDSMSDKSGLMATYPLVISNENTTKGFSLTPMFLSFGLGIYLNSKMYGFSGCNENDKLIIVLENNEKINLISHNSFNCTGEGSFKLSRSIIKKLRTSPLYKIRITNGRSGDSYTDTVSINYKYYFLQLFNSYYSKNYQIINF